MVLDRSAGACLLCLPLRGLKQKDQLRPVHPAKHYSETLVSKKAEHSIPSLWVPEIVPIQETQVMASCGAVLSVTYISTTAILSKGQEAGSS